MALVIFQNRRAPSMAIAYNHTINDEPCYDEECTHCGGESSLSWWTDLEDTREEVELHVKTDSESSKEKDGDAVSD